MRPIEPKYHTPEEAVAYTGLGLSTLAKMRMNGDGPSFVKIGAKVLYPRDGLDAFMASRLQRSTSETPRRRSPAASGAAA
jgi:hypothetical protein